MKKTITFKSSLNLKLDKKCKELKVKLKGKAQGMEELAVELVDEKEMAKARFIEKAQLEAERASLRIEKEALQNHNGELERSKLEEAGKTSEAVTHVTTHPGRPP
ncbi:hypothetical protein LIER_21959 [Lithospermum erythrorhizon]|uniref:Uncharacterized protein n=1 Tax=Lithospermum erythrorhizon TaxID=34254 RepID=A0AAV3QXS5_LITER